MPRNALRHFHHEQVSEANLRRVIYNVLRINGLLVVISIAGTWARTSLYCNDAPRPTSSPGPAGMWQPLRSSWSSAAPASCHFVGAVNPRPLVHLSRPDELVSVLRKKCCAHNAPFLRGLAICVGVIVRVLLLKEWPCGHFAE